MAAKMLDEAMQPGKDFYSLLCLWCLSLESPSLKKAMQFGNL
jgi:hypothetical protein